MRFITLILLAGAILLAFLLSGCHDGGGGSGILPSSGNVYTTDVQGELDISIFTHREDVNLNGGPVSTTEAGLPDGVYYCKVTNLNGDILGRSDGPVVVVSGGHFVQINNLWNILYQTDAKGSFLLDSEGNKIPGYRESSDNQYKAWVSLNSNLPSSESYTDTFSIDANPVVYGGAIHTTNAQGELDISLFADKQIVYLNGGPAYLGEAGILDGSYYIKVTTLSGDILGKSATPVIIVNNGSFTQVYLIWSMVYKTDASGNFQLGGGGSKIQGYNDSPNYQYRVWISQDMVFSAKDAKTDNFEIDDTPVIDETAQLQVVKYYDANLNGINDDGLPLNGWLIHINGSAKYDRYTPVDITLAPGTYTVNEAAPRQSNWIPTTPISTQVTLNANDERTVEFGNVCVGPGGAESTIFWGACKAELIGSDDLAVLAALNLRNKNGSAYDPPTYDNFQHWLAAASSINMAYKLSAQLAAMALNIYNGMIDGSELVYAPGTESANSFGFATVNALMAEANAELATHPTAFSDDTWRQYQAVLRNALEEANKDRSFLQSTPSEYSF